jgi:hypothetical protein
MKKVDSVFLKDSTIKNTEQLIKENINNYIKTGNSDKLSDYFFSTIEINLPNTKGSFSKAQAKQMIKNFFTTYPPLTFTIINEGTSGNEKSNYTIGTYETKNNKKFRVYYLIKEISGNSYLTILKFE